MSGWSARPAGRRARPRRFTRPRPVRPRAPTSSSAGTSPQEAEGEKIVDYLFVLADRADMKWPLSTNFYKLISRTADKGKPQYTLPSRGPANAGQAILLACAGEERKRRLGAVEQDVELHAPRAGLSAGRDR